MFTDCAEAYCNEEEIGEALKSAFDKGLVKRYNRHTLCRHA
jgi:diketogulonate reductase-like aldo/keto reductase